MSNERETKYSIREQLKQQIERDRGWYFIIRDRELPNRPFGFTLFGEPFVLLKDANDNLVCYSLALVKDKVEVRSFKVKEKHGEIWFWRGSCS